MKLGIVIEETWDFFHEISTHLSEHHQVSLFERRLYPFKLFQTRINNYLFHHDLRNFMQTNDVVFFEWASDLLLAATRLPKTCGIVTRLHRYELYQWADLIHWNAVDRIILVSEAKKREFLLKKPDQNGKILVIPEAVSLDKFSPNIKEFSGEIGILCHLTPRKRIYDLILIFCELTKEREDLRLHIAGDPHPAYGDYYAALQHIVKELDLVDKVVFHGHVEDTPNWYQMIDIFISNSYSEGLQVSPMEAMASGCYCLSHRWNGANELLPDKYLYYSNSELKNKVLSYCDTPDSEKLREKRRMREIVEMNFDINEHKERVRETIEDVFEAVSA